MVKKKEKLTFAVGKRKTSIARAIVKPGIGKIKINSKPLDLWGNKYLRLWIREPMILSGDLIKKVDIDVNVRSGGIVSQAEAVRMAIAKGLVEFYNDQKLKNKFMQYDRNLLVYDSRRTEPHKPSASKRGSRRHKQRSKR